MLHTVTGFTENKITFQPATLAEEIIQNVRIIITTPKFSVPLDRNFGIDYSCLDKPQHIAEARLVEDIISSIAKYEPRAEVTGITFTANNDGLLIPKVQVKIKDEI